jgi:chromosomal replication initiation ATPase DnaA
VRAGTVLGSDGFVDWVRTHFLDGEGMDSKEIPAVRRLRVPPATIPELSRVVAAALQVDEDSLFRKRAAPAVARSVFLELCRLHLSASMSLTWLGSQLGGMSAAAFTQNKKRLAERMGKDHALRQLFERLTQAMDRQSSVNS